MPGSGLKCYALFYLWDDNGGAMENLNDLYYFAQTVEHGGFAPARRAIGVPRTRLNDIVLGRRGISARFWMNLQSHYEPEVAEQAHGKRLDHEVPPHAA